MASVGGREAGEVSEVEGTGSYEPSEPICSYAFILSGKHCPSVE